MLPELAAEALAAGKPRAIHEFARTDSLAAFELDGFELQPRALAANHLDGITHNQAAGLLRGRSITRQSRCAGPPPNLAQLPAKSSKRTRPRREAANAVVNLAGG